MNFGHEIKNCSLTKHLKLGGFGYILEINSKKHLVIEWLSWLPNKSDFIYSNILEILKESAVRMNLLEQKFNELIGRKLCPPPPTL